jgi:hypothetical protein
MSQTCNVCQSELAAAVSTYCLVNLARQARKEETTVSYNLVEQSFKHQGSVIQLGTTVVCEFFVNALQGL